MCVVILKDEEQRGRRLPVPTLHEDELRQVMLGYGVSLYIGIGIPIPVLNEDMARYTLVKMRISIHRSMTTA
jgi:hypothetical protein